MTAELKNDLERLVEGGLAEEARTSDGIRYEFGETFIAGFRYSDGPDIMPYLLPGEKLDLIAEPGNPHDEWAVRIEHQKSRIGYVPRSINRFISLLLQDGTCITASITNADPAAAPWECVKVKIAVEL